MKKDELYKQNSESPDTTQKEATLLCLAEALRSEVYEECADLIHTAKLYGAKQEDVREVLRGYKKVINRSRSNEAAPKKASSRRFK